MSLKIRMSRGGAKKRPYYRIVVADARAPRDGRFIDRVGSYDPMLPKDAERVKLDLEKIAGWLKKGAQPTDRVARFIHEADASLVKWSRGANLKKGEPGAKAKERAAERAEKEEAKAAAAAEAKAAPKVEEAPAEAPAAEETPAPETPAVEEPAAEEAPAAEAPAAEEAPAEEAPAKEALAAEAEAPAEDEKKD